MAKGGARASSGPAPDPLALRRDRDGELWVTLPAAGRKGKTPSWPLSRATKRETTLWARQWKRPQAIMWERNGQEEEVALYVRSLAAAEDLDATAAQRTLVRQQQEALGLSIPGMARNRWRIEEAEKPAGQPRGRSAAGGATNKRFRVVTGGRA